MNRRSFLKSSGITILSISHYCIRSYANDTHSPSHPNLVFVFPDQFRAQAMGFMRQDPVITPNIDRFAAESRVFDNAVSNWPLCSPYRGMLMTGRWPWSTGLTTNCNSSRPEVYLRQSERTITDVLADNGYTVGYLGKWHLDTPQGVPVVDDWRNAIWDCYTPPGPQRHGITFWHAYGCHNNHLRPHYWIGNAPEEEKTFFDEYSPIHEARIASEFILNTNGQLRDPEKPFALFISMNPPHSPYNLVPEQYKILYDNKTPEELLNRKNVRGNAGPKNVKDYFAAVSGVDDAFGRILNAIDQAKLRENTLVVFSADHGDMMGSQGLMAKVVPFEESFRIPLIIRWPGKIPVGRDNLHINVPDTMPTLLTLMGLGDQIPPAVEGTDYSKAITGNEQKRPTSTFYIRFAGDHSKARGVRTDRYTFIREFNKDGKVADSLYDRQEDPYQLKNVAELKPQIVKQMQAELDHWLKKTNDPVKVEFEI